MGQHAKQCPICYHDQRTDIESALLAGQPASTVAEYYAVELLELEKHIKNCSIYVMSLDEFDKQVAAELASAGDHISANQVKGPYANGTKPGSIQRQLALKEADLLAASAQEYMVTLKNLGRKINRVLNEVDNDPEGVILATRFLKQPITTMYVQIGGEIRQTVRTMAELDKLLNGAEENPLTGLTALAAAIRGSDAPGAAEEDR